MSACACMHEREESVRVTEQRERLKEGHRVRANFTSLTI
jgi:hypothetical protein